MRVIQFNTGYVETKSITAANFLLFIYSFIPVFRLLLFHHAYLSMTKHFVVMGSLAHTTESNSSYNNDCHVDENDGL